MRTRASELRFQWHARPRHQAATARHLDGMAAELKFRVRLCERRAFSAPGYQQPLTASGVPAVAFDGLAEGERL